MGKVIYLSQPDDFKGCTYFNTEHNQGLRNRKTVLEYSYFSINQVVMSLIEITAKYNRVGYPMG